MILSEVRRASELKKLTINFLIIFTGMSVVFGVLSTMTDITEGLLHSVEQDFSQFAGLSHQQLLGVIFFKNLIACAFVAFTSFFLLGIPIIFSILINSAIIGGFLAIYPGFIIGILPHGVIEIPALCISFALGWTIFRRKVKIRHKLQKDDIVYFLKVVIPMLAIAALIEVYITPGIIGLFLPVEPVPLN